MKKYACSLIIAAGLLDFLVFDIAGITLFAPNCLLAVYVALALAVGYAPMAVAGVILGLAIDAVANGFVGMTSISLALAALAGGAFHGRFYADNVIVPAGISFGCIFLQESLIYIVCILLGRNMAGYGTMLLTHILPCAVLTAAVSALSYAVARKGKVQTVQ